jgi:glycyl-tRNA synthetase
MNQVQMEKIIALAKRRGFIFPGSDLYGGLANTYDYGPVGSELLRNIRNLWWDTFVHKREDIVGIDASLISHQEIWKASGHTSGFADALVDCKNCKYRMRADHLIEEYLEKNEEELIGFSQRLATIPDHLTKEIIEKYITQKKVEGLSNEQLDAIIQLHKISCPNCKKCDWTQVRKFNQLFPVQLGIVVGDQALAYLRGETAQGMFVAFKNITESTRVRLPFGVAQNGKSFRNEITPGNSIFRTLVFEQAEIEYFFDPESSNWEELFEAWKNAMWEFITKKVAIKEKGLRWRTHTDDERSFYSKRTEDLEYEFPFGFKELWGLAYRTDYDLSQHQKFSKKDLTITDAQSGKKILPHVIEPAVGIDRIFLMALCDAYTEEENRVVLNFSPKIAPYKAAVFPLLANKPDLVSKAKEIFGMLNTTLTVAWDERGNIGKRYLAQDEIGTPYCITVDFQTIEDSTVTVRDRNTTKQERVAIGSLQEFLKEKIG